MSKRTIHDLIHAAEVLRVSADEHDDLAGTKTTLSAEARAGALAVRRAAATFERLVSESARLRHEQRNKISAP